MKPPHFIKLANLQATHWLTAEEEPPMAATALVGDMEILVPLAGFIDTDAESRGSTKPSANTNRKFSD